MKYEYCMAYYTGPNRCIAITASNQQPIVEKKFMLDLFNRLGSDGWRLCQTIEMKNLPVFLPGEESYIYYLERQL